MARYIIKNNLPTELGLSTRRWKTEVAAREDFMAIVEMLSRIHHTKVVLRTKHLRGTIQVEIDGFYYYVELYKEKS